MDGDPGIPCIKCGKKAFKITYNRRQCDYCGENWEVNEPPPSTPEERIENALRYLGTTDHKMFSSSKVCPLCRTINILRGD